MLSHGAPTTQQNKKKASRACDSENFPSRAILTTQSTSIESQQCPDHSNMPRKDPNKQLTNIKAVKILDFF